MIRLRHAWQRLRENLQHLEQNDELNVFLHGLMYQRRLERGYVPK
jgi:hypothetical protein